MENGNGIKKEHRLTKLESGMEGLQNDISEIKNNHLDHIYKKISCIETKLHKMDMKLAFYAGGLAVVSFIAPLIIDKLL